MANQLSNWGRLQASLAVGFISFLFTPGGFAPRTFFFFLFSAIFFGSTMLIETLDAEKEKATLEAAEKNRQTMDEFTKRRDEEWERTKKKWAQAQAAKAREQNEQDATGNQHSEQAKEQSSNKEEEPRERNWREQYGQSQHENEAHERAQKEDQRRRASKFSSRKDPWAVLGLERTANSEEIKAAYKKLVKENHPDKVSHMDQEFQKLAERRIKDINEAYESLK